LIRHTSVLTRRHDVLVTCCGQGGESGLHEAAQRFRCSCGNPCSGPWGCSGRRWIARMGVGSSARAPLAQGLAWRLAVSRLVRLLAG
jgi:hypothetical protein